MITYDEEELSTPVSQWIKEISFCPIKTKVVDALPYIKTIAKMDHGINIVAIKILKEGVFIELLEVIVE